MTAKHTPEPWVLSSDDFVAAESDQLNNGEYILSCFGQDQAANARRIVACVNACRGLPTDELEQKGLVAAVGTQLLDADELIVQARSQASTWKARATTEAAISRDLKQQCDELLEALEALFHEASQQNLHKANDVIAKVKGGKG